MASFNGMANLTGPYNNKDRLIKSNQKKPFKSVASDKNIGLEDYELYQLGAYHMIGDDAYEPQRTNNFELHIYFDTDDLSPDTAGNAVNVNGTPYDLHTVDSGDPIDNVTAQQTLTLSVQSVGNISTNVEPIQVSYGNTKVKFAGPPDISTTEIVFSDYLGKGTERILAAWHGQVFNPSTQAIGRASRYKKTAVLLETAPDGSQGRAWRLLGIWPSSITYGGYDYSNAAVRQITATFSYDIAIPLD